MTHFKNIFMTFVALSITLCINAQDKDFITHTVNKGQTLYAISKLYNTTVEEIVRLNPKSASTISVGQQLRIPYGTNANGQKVMTRKSEDGTIYHTIQSGETLYRLGKIYGISPKEICDANPGLSTSNFRVGETIRIPSVEIIAVEQESENPKEENVTPTKQYKHIYNHKVKKGETINDLAKKYKVTKEEILAANPELNGKEPKRKMIVRIPLDESRVNNGGTANKDNGNSQNSITNKEQLPTKASYNDGILKVAVVLPFLLDSYAPSEQGRMIEYYQGFLMAVEKLKDMGYSFEINTYDSGPQENSLHELLSSGALDNMELIIGAMYPKHNKELSKFALEKKIPLVIPFTNKDNEIFRNPQVYCVNALQSYLIPDVTEHFMTTFPNANIVFVEEEDEKNNKKEFINKLTEKLDINAVSNVTVPMYNLTTPETTLITLKEFLREDKENIIIPTSSSSATLNTLLPTLQQADIIDSLDIPDYKLFGYPEWQIYAKDTREQMYEVETYFYATFYSHYSMPEVTRFQEEYIKRYNCGIQNIYPRYGMLGYDTGYYFLLATSIYGEQLAEKINDLGYAPIQTGFRFERNKNGAMINKKVNFIHYTPDYRIEKIDFDE